MKHLKVFVELASCLNRTFGVSSLLLALAAFAIAALCSADAIENMLSARWPVWAQMVQPGAWALLTASVCGIVWHLWHRLCAALSPKFKLRCMAEDVDALAESLSNDENYERDAQGGLGPPLLCLETEIAALKGKLETIGVHSPPSAEGGAWRNYLPLLRNWVAAGNLSKARWYRPGTTAIAGARRYGIGS